MCLAIPGRVVSLTGADVTRSGRVDFGGLSKEINLAFVPEAQVGDFVLVHVGFAISLIDETEAGRVLETLKELAGLGDDTDARGPL